MLKINIGILNKRDRHEGLRVKGLEVRKSQKSLSLNLFRIRKEACPMDLEPGQTSTREVTQ